MNIHINQYTNYQRWDKKKIFDEYPLYIKKNNYTITMFFKDKDAIKNLIEVLESTLAEIENKEWLDGPFKKDDEKENVFE